ncbi:hypothetical protein MNBD_GAMMA26-1418 [hydrothermal vent metagenome]|uniref:Flagellar protein FliL n=1 Tax=hydrothermal vent metagenome TaxID=652676 RepID=A0A3B1B523_9ZZZZ
MRHILLLILSTMLLVAGYSYAEDEDKQAHYVSLKPSLVVNMKEGAKYARIDLQVMTRDEEQLEDLKLHGAAIRHELILLLSEQTGSSLKTPAGKEAFRQTALASAQEVMKDLTGKTSIDELFFTSFFVQ